MQTQCGFADRFCWPASSVAVSVRPTTDSITRGTLTMKQIALLFVALVISARADSIQGDIKLNYSESMFADNVFKKEFGKVVKATTSWHAGDFFGEETIFAGITVTNTGSKPM